MIMMWLGPRYPKLPGITWDDEDVEEEPVPVLTRAQRLAIRMEKLTTLTQSAVPGATRPTTVTYKLAVLGAYQSGKSTLLGHWLHLRGTSRDTPLRRSSLRGSSGCRSALIHGSTIYISGSVSKQQLYALQQRAKQADKARSAFAWVMDTNPEARDRGRTIGVNLQDIELQAPVAPVAQRAPAAADQPSRRMLLMDCSGERSQLSSVYSACGIADGAVLVS